MKLAILGAGGFRTPVIYRAIVRGQTSVSYHEIALYDVDASRLARIGTVLDGIDEAEGRSIPHPIASTVEDAVQGADVVYCAVRVGGLDGRHADETVAIEAGVIGQETAGAGGIAFALRTVPVVMGFAEAVSRIAPDALFINFTNPVGLVTEALRRVLGDRVIGICDAPEDLCRRIARAVEIPYEELWFDYAGLNHLGWVRAVRHRGRDLLPGLLADRARVESIEEGRLFGADWLASLGMVPNEYLFYYDFQDRALEAMRSGTVRSEFLRPQQDAFYATAGTPAEALRDWQTTLTEREQHYMDEAWAGRDVLHEAVITDRQPGGYGALALGVVDALYGDRTAIRILDVANRGSIAFLDAEAVVEVPCVVGPGGVVPVTAGTLPLEAQGLISAVRASDRAAIDAALSGSRSEAVRAFALHPLVPSVDVAERLVAAYLERIPGLREVLA